MILTICPNPSIDCTVELDSLNVGQLNRVNSKTETYSGKALNVAKGVARLGEECIATGFMFNEHAKVFEYALTKERVKHDFVYCEGKARTNYKIIDKKAMLTEINDRGEKVSREKQIELIESVKNLSKQCDIAVMSGSLPLGVEHSFYREVLSVIPENVKKIVDTGKDNLVEALKTGVYLVKPNIIELEDYVNSILHSHKDVISACRTLIDHGAQNVLCSLGSEGAIFTDGSRSYYCKSANVAINSTVGAGDSMVASAAVQIMKGADAEEILRCAVAAGTAAITTSGTNLFYKDKYDEIYKKISVEEIK